VNSFLNIRVADVEAIYAGWSARGAEFLTRPVDHGRGAVVSMPVGVTPASDCE